MKNFTSTWFHLQGSNPCQFTPNSGISTSGAKKLFWHRVALEDGQSRVDDIASQGEMSSPAKLSGPAKSHVPAKKNFWISIWNGILLKK